MLLLSQVTKVGRATSVAEQLGLEDKRQRLRSQIKTWMANLYTYMGELAEAEHDAYLVDESDEEDTEDRFWTTEAGRDDTAEAEAETIDLPLPSKFGMVKCKASGLGRLAERELLLRQGQANDALQQIRFHLGQKSLLFRQYVRAARGSQQKKTRAWSMVNAVDISVKKYARIYRSARNAMVSLQAGETILTRYQPLLAEHLKVTTTTLDPAQRGQRNTPLPWFWTLGLKEDAKSASWMTECKCLISA